eukprot:CAMPEP_0175087956 /NCGR_PEP_ID=MMETSP0052_2-20121109/30121_1 /TAXON_ID=51329 ORGANISM="Polytomella parva, Strain SAG 63-3" /NCGR_SAMPLE_ID=MMETSP0052_2 /ASSEMBLY_ACC=CAM_ASM_000194 /LENGTH=838 /DNA_ID=CAMNT_0016360365 /DNA_START=61 /DNA_END=2575 /DNA_ORIENTATION=-
MAYEGRASSLQGVSLRFLANLANSLDSQDYTTREIIENFICPVTSAGQSYNVHLLPEQIGKADYYVIHSWDANFVSDLVYPILEHFIGNPESVKPFQSSLLDHTFIYLDIFCSPQIVALSDGSTHSATERLPVNEHEVRSSSLKRLDSILSQVSGVLFMLTPDGLALSRSWCLYEVWRATQIVAAVAAAEAEAAVKSSTVDSSPGSSRRSCSLIIPIFGFSLSVLADALEDFSLMDAQSSDPMDPSSFATSSCSGSILGLPWARTFAQALAHLPMRDVSTSLSSQEAIATLEDVSGQIQEILEEAIFAEAENVAIHFRPDRSSLIPPERFLSCLRKYTSMLQIVRGRSGSSGDGNGGVGGGGGGNDLLLKQKKNPEEVSEADRELVSAAENSVKWHWRLLGEAAKRAIDIAAKRVQGKTGGDGIFAEEVEGTFAEKEEEEEFEGIVTDALAVTDALQDLSRIRRDVEVDLDEAERLAKDVVRRRVLLLGWRTPEVAAACQDLAVIYLRRERLAPAAALLKRAVDTFRICLGGSSMALITALNDLGKAAQGLGALAWAEGLYGESLRVTAAVLGDTHPYAVAAQNNVGVVARARGRLKEAERAFAAALEISNATLGANHSHSVVAQGNLTHVREMMHAQLERARAAKRREEGGGEEEGKKKKKKDGEGSDDSDSSWPDIETFVFQPPEPLPEPAAAVRKVATANDAQLTRLAAVEVVGVERKEGALPGLVAAIEEEGKKGSKEMGRDDGIKEMRKEQSKVAEAGEIEQVSMEEEKGPKSDEEAFGKKEEEEEGEREEELLSEGEERRGVIKDIEETAIRENEEGRKEEKDGEMGGAKEG